MIVAMLMCRAFSPRTHVRLKAHVLAMGLYTTGLQPFSNQLKG